MKRRAEFIPVEAPELGDSNNPLVLPGWAVTRVYFADATDDQPRRYIVDAEYLVRPGWRGFRRTGRWR